MWTWDGGGTTHSSTQSAGVDEANAPGHGGGDRRGGGGGIGPWPASGSVRRSLSFLVVGVGSESLMMWLMHARVDALPLPLLLSARGRGKQTEGAGRWYADGFGSSCQWDKYLILDITSLYTTLGRAGLPKWALCVRSTRDIQWAHPGLSPIVCVIEIQFSLPYRPLVSSQSVSLSSFACWLWFKIKGLHLQSCPLRHCRYDSL